LAKAVRGESVTWTSASLEPIRTDGAITGIRVEIKPSIIQDVQAATDKFAIANLISYKDLRSYVGKLTHMASLVYVMRPFLLEFYAALKGTVQSTAPSHSIWSKQLSSALRWIAALLDGSQGRFSRSYDLDTHLGLGTAVEINLDASPWGLGGTLSINGVFTHWFACSLSAEECQLLRIEVGSSSCQQTVESLAALVALRVWHTQWSQARAVLKVRSDSVAALTITLKLKTTGHGTGIVAREMALDVAYALYAPHISEHVPGVSNVTCDMLSRKFQPGATYVVPSALAAAKETVLQPRTRAYFRTAAPPTSERK